MRDGDKWYRDSLTRFTNGAEFLRSYANFSTIRFAARQAERYSALRQDLPFWLGLIERFIDGDVEIGLRRRAIYELAYLSFKALGTLLGKEDQLREYFNAVDYLEEASELEDVSNLLKVCITAQRGNRILLSLDEIANWWDQITHLVESKLREVKSPNGKCLFFELRGHLSMIGDPRQPRRPNLETAVEWWLKLVALARRAPLFPLERFADRLTTYLEFLDEPPSYDLLTGKVDALLSKRFGGFIAAEKCRDRAVALYDRGKLLKAVSELHRAKLDWFAAETLEGSILATLFISQCYLQLGLSFAAKYYALAAGSFAWDSDRQDLKHQLPRALIQVAVCDYYQGSWMSFIEIMETALEAHLRFEEDAENLGIHENVKIGVSKLLRLKATAKEIAPTFIPLVNMKIREWGLDDIENAWKSRTGTRKDGSESPETWDSIEKDFRDIPFSDVGPARRVNWSALGVEWTFVWINDYDRTRSAEQFMAILQIFLAELATLDLCLLKTNVTIEIDTSPSQDIEIESLPSHSGRKWQVRLPTYAIHRIREMERLQGDVLTAANCILSEISLLSDQNYHKLIDQCFANGISMKAFIAKPYELIYWEFVSPELFRASNRESKTPPQPPRALSFSDSEELAWIGGLGPGYSAEAAAELNAKRYRNAMRYICLTLDRLLSNREFKRVVDKLRGEGWLDWHILNSISEVKTNTLLNEGKQIFPGIDDSELQRLIDENETEGSLLIPESYFTEDKLRFCRIVSMLATLNVLGLQCRQRTPDFMAIEHFLKNRYNYWTDDIKHDDPFVW